MVAALTECEPGVPSEKNPTTTLVSTGQRPRWARRLAVHFDAGEFSIVRNRETSPAFNIHWYHVCYDWRVNFNPVQINPIACEPIAARRVTKQDR
jgi:hypothetical protein